MNQSATGKVNYSKIINGVTFDYTVTFDLACEIEVEHHFLQLPLSAQKMMANEETRSMAEIFRKLLYHISPFALLDAFAARQWHPFVLAYQKLLDEESAKRPIKESISPALTSFLNHKRDYIKYLEGLVDIENRRGVINFLRNAKYARASLVTELVLDIYPLLEQYNLLSPTFEVLAEKPNETCYQLFLDVLSDDASTVEHRFALKGLGHFRKEALKPVLLQYYKTHSQLNEYTQKAFVNTLKHYPDEEVIEILFNILVGGNNAAYEANQALQFCGVPLEKICRRLVFWFNKSATAKQLEVSAFIFSSAKDGDALPSPEQLLDVIVHGKSNTLEMGNIYPKVSKEIRDQINHLLAHGSESVRGRMIRQYKQLGHPSDILALLVRFDFEIYQNKKLILDTLATLFEKFSVQLGIVKKVLIIYERNQDYDIEGKVIRCLMEICRTNPHDYIKTYFMQKIEKQDLSNRDMKNIINVLRYFNSEEEVRTKLSHLSNNVDVGDTAKHALNYNYKPRVEVAKQVNKIQLMVHGIKNYDKEKKEEKKEENQEVALYTVLILSLGYAIMWFLSKMLK